MLENQLFELALNIHNPLYISKIKFQAEQKRFGRVSKSMMLIMNV